MSDNETQVTFVGGKAIEQNESVDSNLPVEDREAAKEAVRKAMKEAAEAEGEEAARVTKEQKKAKLKEPKKDSEEDEDEPAPKRASKKEDSEEDDKGPQRGPDGKFLPKGSTSEGKPQKSAKGTTSPEKEDSGAEEEESEEVPDINKSSVKQILRAREKVAAVHKQAAQERQEQEQWRQQAQRERQQFEQERAQFQQAQAQLQRQYQAMQELKNDPTRLMREFGYEPEQFILDLAQDGTPEGKARREQMELRQKVAKFEQWQKDQAEAARRHQAMRQQQAAAEHRTKSVNTFLDLAQDESKYPNISLLYGGQERALVAIGDIASDEYYQLTGGKVAPFEDILDYIEDELATKLKKRYNNSVGSQKSDTSTQPQAGKSKGKTLNPSASGERRATTHSNLVDLDADERKEAAKLAVKAALRASQDSDSDNDS